MRKSWLAIVASGFGVLLSGCATTGEAEALPVCPTETRGWAAWINAMPGPDAVPTLIVTGEVLLPENATATLAAEPTDRMMPPGQRVALTIAPADRASGWEQVRLEIKPALPAYSSVIVGCGGSQLATIAPIESAH
ncbi:hypothetical protein [Croceicoccus bisphenolivorans]|uniref:hypothetical protein n=1 Tax=Croceicoccus bisphenolivorans TaxID=1783232 RepID=UPI000831E8E7|nr:hypothetical protein [Croceicoccus bisphenolivorans]